MPLLIVHNMIDSLFQSRISTTIPSTGIGLARAQGDDTEEDVLEGEEEEEEDEEEVEIEDEEEDEDTEVEVGSMAFLSQFRREKKLNTSTGIWYT